MLITRCDTVAPKHAITILIARIKSATLTQINVNWITTAPIGLSAARLHSALRVKVIVMKTQSVKDHLCAALTIVPMDQLFWIVVNRRYTKVNHIEDLKLRIYAALQYFRVWRHFDWKHGIFCYP